MLLFLKTSREQRKLFRYETIGGEQSCLAVEEYLPKEGKLLISHYLVKAVAAMQE